MSKYEKMTLRELAGSYLLNFPILDNSIASVFSCVFGARSNSVEIFYGNLSLQNRIDCISAFCEQHAFPFDKDEKKSIEDILSEAKDLQRLRNLLAHHMVLDDEILVRGGYPFPIKRDPDPEKLFVWKTNRKGKYEVKPLTKREVRNAIDRILITSVNISVLCANIRLRYGVRP